MNISHFFRLLMKFHTWRKASYNKFKERNILIMQKRKNTPFEILKTVDYMKSMSS